MNLKKYIKNVHKSSFSTEIALITISEILNISNKYELNSTKNHSVYVFSFTTFPIQYKEMY